MATQVLSAVRGTTTKLAPIRRALISVFDKTDVVDFAKELQSFGVEIISTGGTAASLREAGLQVYDVSDLTNAPEILNGRVKSLHPAVHGGVLAVRGNDEHREWGRFFAGQHFDASFFAVEQMKSVMPASFSQHPFIDCVVGNLYPFQDAVQQHSDSPATIIENIDIGGPTMLRSAAKNHQYCLPLPSPSEYEGALRHIRDASAGQQHAHSELYFRQQMAAKTFSVLSAYDTQVADWLASRTLDGSDSSSSSMPLVSRRAYCVQHPLKYGNNPHQTPAAVAMDAAPADAAPLPYTIVNGSPGYINLLDALNAWQLVRELSAAASAFKGESVPAAASFKHVSPAGAALGLPLSAEMMETYAVSPAQAENMTPLAAAYLRARQCDPLCSFGDFVAVSHVVDEQTARVLKSEVSDGIIAPGFTDEAKAILSQKKKGAYIMLAMDEAYEPADMEWREVFGVAMAQRRNTTAVDSESLTKLPVCGGAPSDAQVLDMLVASITVKYTQSNSIGFAKDGQMVGVGAGQQSRVDCVKLAGRKVATWHLRFHPKVRSLPFKAGVKKQERVNARVRYIEGDMAPTEEQAWLQLFESPPAPLTQEDKDAFMQQLQGVSLSSDAFFPFRDGIDAAARFGVDCVAQPGGSMGDGAVQAAAEEYGMRMVHTGIRLFHH